MFWKSLWGVFCFVPLHENLWPRREKELRVLRAGSGRGGPCSEAFAEGPAARACVRVLRVHSLETLRIEFRAGRIPCRFERPGLRGEYNTGGGAWSVTVGKCIEDGGLREAIAVGPWERFRGTQALGSAL